MEVSDLFHASAALSPGVDPPGTYSTGGLGGPQSRSRPCGEEKSILLLPGIEPRPSSPLVTI
jgi:hypothetical protein